MGRDWRDHNLVNPVQNQGSCGSCWAFSTIVSIEGAHAKATGDLVKLSEQNLVDCVKGQHDPSNGQSCCNGCRGGLMNDAMQYVIDKQSGGVDTEAAYGYHGVGGKCNGGAWAPDGGASEKASSKASPASQAARSRRRIAELKRKIGAAEGARGARAEQQAAAKRARRRIQDLKAEIGREEARLQAAIWQFDPHSPPPSLLPSFFCDR